MEEENNKEGEGENENDEEENKNEDDGEENKQEDDNNKEQDQSLLLFEEEDVGQGDQAMVVVPEDDKKKSLDDSDLSPNISQNNFFKQGEVREVEKTEGKEDSHDEENGLEEDDMDNNQDDGVDLATETIGKFNISTVRCFIYFFFLC